MTHSGGLPHTNVGDRGQRYEIAVTGYPRRGGETVVGWAASLQAAEEMVSAFCQAPGATSVTVRDRQDGNKKLITRFCGVLR